MNSNIKCTDVYVTQARINEVTIMQTIMQTINSLEISFLIQYRLCDYDIFLYIDHTHTRYYYYYYYYFQIRLVVLISII